MENEVIMFNDVLPEERRIKKLQTGSELLLAYEVGKYVKLLLGKEYKVGLPLVGELTLGLPYQFVVSQGLGFGSNLDPARFTLKKEDARYFFTDTVEDVVLGSDEPDLVVFDFYADTLKNAKFNRDNRSAAYVSLVAYLLVRAYRDGTPMPKVEFGSPYYVQRQGEFTDLLILQDYGNKVLKGVVVVRYAPQEDVQPEVEAFFAYHRQRGDMLNESTVDAKFRYLKKHFQVGDVVLRYKYKKIQETKDVFVLAECYPAVIRGFTEREITLNYYPHTQTRLSRHMELSQVDGALEEMPGLSHLSVEDYERFREATETYSLHDIGINTLTHREQVFIIKFHESVDLDGRPQWIKTDEGYQNVYMPTTDSVYAVFEDRGVKYNKERFLKEYFHDRKRTPMIDSYPYFREQ